MTRGQQKANAAYMYCFLYNRGWTRQAIGGLFGNIEQECGMNPGAWQTGKEAHGYGLFQWTAATKYLDWSGYNGDYVDKMVETNKTRKKLINSQLNYFLHSCTTKDYTQLQWYTDQSGKSRFKNNLTFDEFRKSTASPGYLAKVFWANYERNDDDLKQWGNGKTLLDKRAANAEIWYKYLNTIN